MEKKHKIVVADDNINIRQNWLDILTDKGYQVSTVKDGYELLNYLRKESPEIIILDMIMPDKDGIEIFSSIKSIVPSSKIIIYTGFERYEHSVYAGIADKFLLKSDNPEILLKEIEELLEK